MLLERVVAFFPAIHGLVAEVADAVIRIVRVWLEEEAGASKLVSSVSLSVEERARLHTLSGSIFLCGQFNALLEPFTVEPRFFVVF